MWIISDSDASHEEQFLRSLRKKRNSSCCCYEFSFSTVQVGDCAVLSHATPLDGPISKSGPPESFPQ